jgi:hypothetical protein
VKREKKEGHSLNNKLNILDEYNNEFNKQI